MSNQRASPTYYRNAFKLALVQKVAQGQISKEEARRKYGIQAKSAVLAWMRKMGYAQPAAEKGMSKHQANNTPQAHVAQLEQQLAQVQSALENAAIRSEAYQTMIELAAAKYTLPIRKKFATKPFKQSKRATSK